MIRRLGVLAAGLVVPLYLGAGGYLYTAQRSFVFKPSGELVSPVDAGLAGVVAATVAMADGTPETVWVAPARPGYPTILYFHGNGGNVSTRADRFAEILGSGFGLYAPSQRGYPGSGGEPSEVAFVADGVEHFDRLAATGAQIVIHGESLGTGVATAVAAQRNAAALILEAPFTAALDVAADTYPWLPVSILMSDQFLSRERIANVHAPVLILHGTADEVIPVEQGRALFALANEPKALEIMPGIDHGSLWKNGLWERVLAFLAETGVAGSQ
jgi:fermentation-respiration switch protein FrsA (DUF1100 family)